jgi:putative transposase
MKKSKYADIQILSILNRAESGVPASELCREHGMISATFYKCRAKYWRMDASMMSRLKALEEKKLKAEIIKGAMEKK